MAFTLAGMLVSAWIAIHVVLPVSAIILRPQRQPFASNSFEPHELSRSRLCSSPLSDPDADVEECEACFADRREVARSVQMDMRLDPVAGSVTLDPSHMRKIPSDLAAEIERREDETRRGLMYGGEQNASFAALDILRKRVANVMSKEAPYYWHGQYYDKSFDDGYLLKEELNEMTPQGNWAQLMPLMRKLEAGGNATILVLGGSMTVGSNCKQKVGNQSLVDKDCAWSARFASWLQGAYPQSHINLVNTAACMMTSNVQITQIGTTLSSLHHDVDMAMIDLSINGGSPDATEQMIRVIRALVPKAVVFGCVLWPGSRAKGNRKDPGGPAFQLKLFQYYDLPIFNFRDISTKRPELWGHPETRSPGVVHPTWPTHQRVADLMANVWGKFWNSKQHESLNSELPKLPDPLIKGADTLRICVAPLTHFSAEESYKDATGELPRPTVSAGNWSLYEDRPGKPGWISETVKSEMRFPLNFGATPTLNIVYMKSYEHMGNAMFTIEGTNASETLHGFWYFHDSGLVAFQSTSLPSNLVNTTGTVVMRYTGTQSGAKFKVTEVMSC